MKGILMAATVAAALGFSSAGHAAMTKAEFNAEKDRLEANYDAAKRKCSSFAGNAKGICVAEARGSYRVARTELEERHNDSPKSRYKVRIAKTEAEYDVAKQKCDDRAGARKDACLAEAKAAFARDKADAVASHTPR